LLKPTLTILGAFVVSSFAASAQTTFRIDHFKCYFPSQVSAVQPDAVVLEDQFGVNTANIGRPFRLCNPTAKYHAGVVTPIVNPDDHLVLHSTGPQPLVTREVSIRNQFGDQPLVTQDAKILAVPTQKDPHGPPKDINHFSCYVVSNGTPVNAPVSLRDQFFTSNHKAARPYLFCNPVKKTHNGMISPITNPDDHLTCYTMNRVPYARDVSLHNQFGDFTLRTNNADILCVPTQKLAWRVVQ